MSKCAVFMSAVLVFMLSAGCGKKQSSSPPRACSQLVLELYSALEKKDHNTAIAKLKRLRELDTGNIFLANLEIIERNNLITNDVEKSLDEGNLKGAMEQIKKALASFGKHDDLNAVSMDLDTVQQISKNLDILSSEDTDAVTLARTAGTLKSIARNYKPAEIFIPIADNKLALSKIMNRWEKQRAIEDLLSDYFFAKAEKNRISDAILINIYMENPEHPEIKKYLDYISAVIKK